MTPRLLHRGSNKGGSLLFVANERTRVIHDSECQTDKCGLYSETTADQVSIADPAAVKQMIQQQHFRPCPECMIDLSWE